MGVDGKGAELMENPDDAAAAETGGTGLAETRP